MPCFRCGARQTDPVRGVSLWKRGVRADRQILICPGCQSTHDWADDLDRCAACGSVALVCRLGEVECRDCHHTREAAPADLVHSGAAPPTSGDRDLSEEVAAALNRVLRRGRGT
ncbi:hypothetical protein BZB76_5853 [Actinomadura pelletieri DSM 43383]|uniref:Uncharacterized protein n=1 Tax=Actinomadura pelletieri DSM 43383 TaxID=1120940 RepID=A0A495QAL5_9ACTN|nr:hypothetical protein [Actinomadura pelletieri]RKS68728.1 hypothetical protein BZB76_5853 [Actinomadura pelletieri DSM 43383]